MASQSQLNDRGMPLEWLNKSGKDAICEGSRVKGFRGLGFRGLGLSRGLGLRVYGFRV